jgi:hypothetical protein
LIEWFRRYREDPSMRDRVFDFSRYWRAKEFSDRRENE